MTPVDASCFAPATPRRAAVSGAGVSRRAAILGACPLIAAALLAAPTLALAQSREQSPAAGDVQHGAAGVEQQWIHESWTVADGLPVNSVNGLLQSRDGYIWAATFDGLVRFDGVRFTVFNSSNSEGLPSNRLVWLHETRDGSIWLKTEAGQLIRLRDGEFTHIGPSRGLSVRVIESFEDSNGVMWVGTPRGVGYIEGDVFVSSTPARLAAPVTHIVERHDGSLWIGTTGAGLSRVANGAVDQPGLPGALESATIEGLYEDAFGRLWVGTAMGVWLENDGWQQVSSQPGVTAFAGASGTRAIYAHSHAGASRIDGEVTVVIDTTRRIIPSPLWSDGTTVWHGAGNRLLRNDTVVYSLQSDETTPLPATTITSAIIDREGSIWLGTFADGLHRLKRATFAVYGEPEGLAYRNVYAVYEDPTGVVWVGTWGGGLSRVDPAGGQVAVSRARIDPPANVTSIHTDGAGGLWVGGLDGLYACRAPVRNCTPAGPPGLRSSVFAIHGDGSGRLWIGAVGGLFVLEHGVWTRLSESAGAPSAPVRAFANTRDGALWMGTNGSGIVRYAGGRFTRIDTRGGLPSDLVRALYEDADGWLWVGTEGRGLARLDPRAWGDAPGKHSRRIVRYGMADGLFDEVIHQILEDEFGRLWMSTNRGIFQVRRAQLNAFADSATEVIRSIAYTERDGLRNREANGGVQPAGARTRDGRLWFPTQNGVAVVDPARLHGNTLPPPVVVERLLAGGDAFVLGRGRLELGSDRRDLEIEYTALSLLEPANVRFRYRLDPYDAAWVDAGSRRIAYYTRVPPGSYTFRVIASNNDGVWNETGAAIELSVTPLFHETRTFYALLAVALILLLVGGHRWRMRNLRRRADELTRLVDERTSALRHNERQLESKNAELADLHDARSRLFANLSHEFRTPLTLILGPLRSLLDGRHGPLHASARDQGELMQRNAQRLLRLINQILDLARLQAGGLALDTRSHDIVGFARAVTLAFAPLAERRGVALQFHSEVGALDVVFDAEQLEKVLLNLLSNALKFTEQGGAVDVSVGIDATDDFVVIVVKDTGVGIAADQLPHVFDRFYQADSSATRRYEGTGIGLSLAKELVELHGGEIRVASTRGAGSTFTTRLPLGRVPARSSAADTVVDEASRARIEISGVTVNGEGKRAQLSPREVLAASTEVCEPDSTSPASGTRSDEDRTTVLVVDDNADVRAYVRSVLTPTYRVLESADGRAGLETARTALPDLIVADVMMPELDGLGLGRALKDDPMTDAIPVVLLTARASAEDQVAGLGTGADTYLVKPFDPGVLEATIAGLLAQRRRLRERFRIGEALPPASAAVSVSALEARLRPLVEAHLTDAGFNPDALAVAAGLTYQQLYRALRDELAVSPSRFIRTVRVECASKLLQQGAGSVTEIAYAVGFESLSYFRRAFRERFDTAPGEHLAATPPA